MDLITDIINNQNHFYNKTGFVFLEDEEHNYYLYYKKYTLLIPLYNQSLSFTIPYYAYISDIRNYIENIVSDFKKLYQINIGKTERKWRLPKEDESDLFSDLYKTVPFFKTFSDSYKPFFLGLNNWLLEKNIYNEPQSYYNVYDNSVRKITTPLSLSLLKCIDLKEGRYYTPIINWEFDLRVWKELGLTPIDIECFEEDIEDIKESEENTEEMSEEEEDFTFKKFLLECDTRRCRLEAYDESQLYDIKKGHWDLFENIDEIKKEYLECLEDPDSLEIDSEIEDILPRDPRQDIKNGIIGIDFGTKSTVVVRQNDTDEIIPVRIGTVELRKEVEESDYENPTIIECSDLDIFLSSYNSKQGRPETNCEDFFISYDAYNDYMNCPPDEFYAYYTELKQWSNNEKTNVLIKDIYENTFSFSHKNSLENKTINPIELYAYYIGMYINNMRNGIYMNYLLSFPVGYSKKTRSLILSSFENGIKKSLPEIVLKDKNYMKNFSVKFGISEPAAYAVTALELSNLQPKDENEKYIYGIFDFGGGTTDFDFGIWRGADDDEIEDGYDYVLECFGADSDVTLGGENILELLAYNVFKENQKIIRENKITFSLPVGEKPFLGSELLIENSQVSMRNMITLKEKLRPLWHQEENWKDLYKDNDEENSKNNNECLNELTLYNIEGKHQPNIKLKINTDNLIEIIKQRIQKGVDSFFKCMADTFLKNEEIRENFEFDENNPNNKIYIFLAGNASKSVFVKEIFEKKINFYNEKVNKNNLDEDDSNKGNSYFKLIEPLANKKKNGEYTPNAKTSVAYGLLKSREGSSIKIIKNNETDSETETRFKYYLGKIRRGDFQCVLNPKSDCKNWVKFQSANSKSIIRIYYTSNPTVGYSSENTDINNIQYKEIKIQPEEGKYLYIRISEPTVIEYSVSTSEEEIDKNKILKINFDN